MPEKSLPPVLQEAIDHYIRWCDKHLIIEQNQRAIQTTLYHYTDGHGLKGIIENEAFWLTDYRHLNDPSELVHGIGIARHVMTEIGTGADPRVSLFLGVLDDLFSHENFSQTLEFFIVSFSAERDDLGQWRAYADNGHGYALGLAPKLFEVIEDAGLKPNEKAFVAPVVYDIDEILQRHRIPLEEAVSIFLNTANANAELLKDRNIGIPFMQEMARAVIASPLIWNCLTSKHPAYSHEREARLIILGSKSNLKPYVKTRLRGSEIVPYITHQMPIRKPHSITEILVGPSAHSSAERSVRTMLDGLGIDVDVPIKRSEIPYRTV